MAAPDEEHTTDLGREKFVNPLENMTRDEPLTPPPLAKERIKLTSGLPLESNGGSDSMTTEDGIDKEVTSTEGVNDSMDNIEEHSEAGNEVHKEIDKGEDNQAKDDGSDILVIDTESNSEVNHDEIPVNSGIIGNGMLVNEVSSNNAVATDDISNLIVNNIVTQSRPENVPLSNNNSEAIILDVQERPPFKGVMVPCGQLKAYLDSLPTFNRKTMLRKGREVHKIYVDMKKGECFLDDQFSYTEFGKLVLSNGSIRAGRAKNAKQIVVARETLYCSGTGACKRACGGYGICVPGCDKTKMRGHRCGYRVKLTQRLGYVNFWFVEILGAHDQLGSKDNSVVETSAKLKLPFTPNFAIDLTNTPNNTVKSKRRSPSNNSKLLARFTKTNSSPINGNLSLNASENSSPVTSVSYHYVLDNEPLRPPSSSHTSREPTPIDLSDTSQMHMLYTHESSSQQAIDIYQKHAQEAAINAIKSQGGFTMPTLTPEDAQPQDLSGKVLSSPPLVNVKQEPTDTHLSPTFISQNNSPRQGQDHSPLISQGQSPVLGQGQFHDRPGQKMQATQETLGQVHSRIMERARSRKSSRTLHIPREILPESKQSNTNYVQSSNHLQIPVVPPTQNLNIPNVPLSSSNVTTNIDFKRFQTLNKILQSEAFQAAKQQLENSWNQSQAHTGFQTSALNLTKKEPESGFQLQLDHTKLLEEWRKGGQLQEFQKFQVKKESLPNGHAEDADLLKSCDSLTKNEKDLLCRVHQLEAHVKQLQNIVIKKEGNGISMTGKKTKAHRPFDFTRYNTRHVALKIAYLGCDYQGFAVQEETEKTIEQVLFDGLKKTRLIESRETSNYHRCGRTDKGVSAFSQVISIDLRTNLLSGVGVKVREGGTAHERPGDKTAEIRYVRILNAVLPPEIRVLAWAPVDTEFSARFSCKKRTYKYIFPKGNLDLQVMDEAAKKLIGEHDYRNFCKMDVGNGVTNFVRKILAADITTVDEKENGYSMCELTIVGSSFLWHQIRCIFSILLLVGQGNETPQIVDELLDIEKNPRKPTYTMAIDIPLVLFDSEFGEDFEWIYEADCHEDNIRTLQDMWAQHAVKAAMLKRMLDDLDKAKVETECDIAPWSDLSPPLLHQADWLMMGAKSKVYKPLMDRPKCESLEDRIEYCAKKRKLNSGEAEQGATTSETD